jgi:hypothetical protein
MTGRVIYWSPDGDDLYGDGTAAKPFQRRAYADLCRASAQDVVVALDDFDGFSLDEEPADFAYEPQAHPLAKAALIVGGVALGWAALIGIGVIAWHNPGTAFLVGCSAVVFGVAVLGGPKKVQP